MEKTILSKENSFRANEIQSIDNPEFGIFTFNYHSKRLGYRHYEHSAINGASEISIPSVTGELNKWEIISFKYTETLAEYWELARRAFANTSFDSYEKGEDTIAAYEQELNDDLKEIPVEEHERYVAKYKSMFSAWLYACSNCASSAIVGGSGFNVRRAEKTNNAEHKRLGEFFEWREKAIKAIAKKIEENKPQEQKDAEAWENLKKDILSSAQTIKAINNGGCRGSSKALFVSSIYNKTETFANRGEFGIVERAIEFIRELNKTSSIITERHKFFKLLEKAKKVIEVKEVRSQKDNIEIPFNGGVIVKNYEADRVQIKYDKKPEPEMIAKLKSHGFKWSPRFGTWQRFNNSNSFHAVSQVISDVTYEQLIQS